MKRYRVISFAVSILLWAAYPAMSSAAAAPHDDVLFSSAREAFPAEVATPSLRTALRGATWNTDRTAAAVAVPRSSGSLVYVFLKQAGGHYLAVDASRVEGGNFGKLGGRAADYERFETRPVRWNRRSDGKWEVVMRTRAWKSGRRYTAAEPLLVQADGQILWR